MDEQQETRTVRKEYGQPAGDSIAQARRVIDQLENRINDSRRVPMSKTLSFVDTGEIIDLIGQLRIVLPHTVVQAQAIMDEKERILSEAKAEADKIADTADTSYKTTIDEANCFKRRYTMRRTPTTGRFARRRRRTRLQSLRTRTPAAEQIIFSAQQQSQKMVDESEITRRAQAYAVETRERAEKDADSIYNQACVQVDKMLSGAAAALSRSASELAALRDSLLTQGANPQDR